MRVCLLVLCCGCSFVMIDRVSNESRPEAVVNCVGSVAPAVYDLVYGVADGIFALAFVSAANNVNVDQQAARTYALVFGAAAAAYGASAIYGFPAASACRDAKADLLRRAYANSRAVTMPAAPAPPPPSQSEGCTTDAECKGDRVCDRRACVTPR